MIFKILKATGIFALCYLTFIGFFFVVLKGFKILLDREASQKHSEDQHKNDK